MKINGRKTKDMLIGPITKDMPPPLILDGATVERVTSFKLLGLAFTYPMILSGHNTLMPSRPKQAASRLYFLKQLRRFMVHHTKTCCASTVQFCARYLNMLVQFGTQALVGWVAQW